MTEFEALTRLEDLGFSCPAWEQQKGANITITPIRNIVLSCWTRNDGAIARGINTDAGWRIAIYEPSVVEGE